VDSHREHYFRIARYTGRDRESILASLHIADQANHNERPAMIALIENASSDGGTAGRHFSQPEDVTKKRERIHHMLKYSSTLQNLLPRTDSVFTSQCLHWIDPRRPPRVWASDAGKAPRRTLYLVNQPDCRHRSRRGRSCFATSPWRYHRGHTTIFVPHVPLSSRCSVAHDAPYANRGDDISVAE